MDDPGLESDGKAEEGVKKKIQKHLRYDGKENGMSAELADG